MNTKLSIIILSWNTKELLRQCLNSLVLSIKNQVLRVEIIVVDNGSTDGSVEYLKSITGITNTTKRTRVGVQHVAPAGIKGGETKVDIKIIENNMNVGFAKANNQGIKIAEGKYIMLLNSDTVVKDGAIGKLVNYLDNHQEVDIIGPKLLNNDGTPQASCGKFPSLPVVFAMLFKEHFGGSDYVRGFLKESGFVDWMMGAAIIARREVFEKTGGLDETIFMYMEEVDWFFRAKKENFRAYYLKDAEIVHQGMGSSKSGKKEPIIHIYEGLLHYYRKHQSKIELIILEILLKIKAFTALIIGWIRHDNYLIETYGQAIKIH